MHEDHIRRTKATLEVTIVPWVDVKDPEYTVTVVDPYGQGEPLSMTWSNHLLIQLPRVDLRDTGGTGGPDFLGGLARAVLRYRSR